MIKGVKPVKGSKRGNLKLNLPLLNVDNPKTIKGEKRDYLTGILYLAPASTSGVMNVCPMSSEGCRSACLNTAGMAMVFPKIHEARKRKTKWLYEDREGFVAQLRADIHQIKRFAQELGMIPAIRINGTSDLPQLAMMLAEEFPDVQFYDYTKIPQPWKRIRSNYHLTFSLSENNFQYAWDALQHGVNVAVVFNTRKSKSLPHEWRGIPVIDGDESDLRFLDTPRGKLGSVVGLRAKGRARRERGKGQRSGFVQIAPLPLFPE